MEATESSNELESFRVPERKGFQQQIDSHPPQLSGSRRTRSQLSPDWTVKDALILVNEIAAVEADCLKALSTYQKWKIIAENCNALDVSRTLNQCRRKWDSLLEEYNKINQWESRSRGNSYWLLERERREFGLPESFDEELFHAIDNLVRAREDQSDTDPESDPEPQVDMLEVVEEPGSRRQRRRLMPPTYHEEAKPQKSRGEVTSCTEEKLQVSPSVENVRISHHLEEKPKKSHREVSPWTICPEENLQMSPLEENSWISHQAEKPNKSHGAVNPQIIHAEETLQIRTSEEKPRITHHKEKPEKEHFSKKPKKGQKNENKRVSTEVEQMLVAKLHEDAEIMHAIIGGSIRKKADYGNQIEDFETDFVRQQGDELIACLGDIVSTLNHFCGLVEDVSSFK